MMKPSQTVLLLVLAFKAIGQGSEEMDTAAFSVNIDEFVITAQYEPTHYKKANHKVEVITKEEMRQRGVVTLDQALVINPSIRINQDPIFGSTIRMRGISSNNVAVLIDGIPVIGRLDGNLDLSQINLNTIERIEIVEGALSNIYGSNAAGGVINLITKKSQVDKWKVELGSQLESVGQQNHNASVGYNHNDLIISLQGRYFDFDQYVPDSLRVLEDIDIGENGTISQPKYPFNPKTQMGLGGFVRYNPGDKGSFLFKMDHNQEDVTDYGVIKRPQFNPYADDRFYKTVRTDYSVNYKNEWGRTFIDLTAAINRYDRSYDDKRFYVESLAFDSLLQRSDTTSFTTYFNRAILSHQVSDHFRTVAGVNYSVEQGSGGRIMDRTRADSTAAQFTEIAPFVEMTYKGIKYLDLTASGRYLIHSIYDARLTPSLLMKYSPGEDWVFRLGYAQGYRSPSLKELYLEFVDINHNISGATDLSPELSHDFQLTVDYSAQPSLDLSLNLYHTIITDRIGLIEYETLKFQYANIDEYKVMGIQPEISYSYNDVTLHSSASLSYWSTDINADTAPSYGEVFDMNNSIEYNYKRAGLKFLVNHRHIGQQPSYGLVNDDVQVNTVDAYDYLDFSANKSFFNNRLHLTTGVRNIFDVTHTPITGGAVGAQTGITGRNPVSIGRSGYVSVHYYLK